MENLDAQLYSLAEQLDRIEEKIDGKHPVQFLDIKQVGELTSLSLSTIRRAVSLGSLKCSRKLGKLLFKQSDVLKWLDG
jgi:predicted DNA-binding transcriptional regulator AlpA